MSSPTRRYYRGHDLVAMRDVQQGQNRCYHFDHQGTTQCLTDSTGAVTDRFACDAWGAKVKRTGNTINRQWYIGNSGYNTDITESTYVRTRHTITRVGRWLSLDPAKISLYDYCTNSPVFQTDPSGLKPQCRVVDFASNYKGVKKTFHRWVTTNRPWMFQVLAFQKRRHWAKVKCIDCCKNPPKRPDYFFYQLKKRSTHVIPYDSRQQEYKEVGWRWDVHGIPPAEPLSVLDELKYPTRPFNGVDVKLIDPFEFLCEYTFQYESCTFPGMRHTSGSLCDPTITPILIPGPDLFRKNQVRNNPNRGYPVEFHFHPNFCTAFGRTAREAFANHRSAWGAEYGLRYGLHYDTDVANWNTDFYPYFTPTGGAGCPATLPGFTISVLDGIEPFEQYDMR